MSLTIEQMRDLTAKLNALTELGHLRDQASEEQRAANRRWNQARERYAALHAKVVAEFGEENAPAWYDSIHGPRAVAA